jgi:hypothetical protein
MPVGLIDKAADEGRYEPMVLAPFSLPEFGLAR